MIGSCFEQLCSECDLIGCLDPWLWLLLGLFCFDDTFEWEEVVEEVDEIVEQIGTDNWCCFCCDVCWLFDFVIVLFDFGVSVLRLFGDLFSV